MPATLVTNGSRASTTTVGSSTNIYNANTFAGAFFVVMADISRLVTGEQFQMTIKADFTNSQFADRIFDQTFTYPPADGPHIQSPPIWAPNFLVADINQLTGTGRLIPWIIGRC